MKEVHILKSLKHPNIPIIYDIEEDEKYSYIIEEYLKGESLKAFRLRLSYLDERSIVDFTFQICDLIQYLHTFHTGILYLDLKPDNILVYKGKLKLLDFGAAVYAEEYKDTSFHMATPGYMAPERLKNLADERSDIYSIGCLLYFLVTGTLYQPSCVSKKWTWILIRNHRFYKLIERCIKVAPSKRFQSVEEVKNYVRKVPRIGEINKESSVMSYCIALAGSEGRVGVTHIALALTSYVSKINGNSIYVEWNESGFLKEFVTYYPEVKERDGYWYVKHTRMQAREDWISDTRKSHYRFIIKDYGKLSEANLEEFLRERNRILVTGTKPWEWKRTMFWMDKLCDCESILYMFNLSNEENQQKIMRNAFCKFCISVPYLKKLFYDSDYQKEKIVFDSVIRYVVSNENTGGDYVFLKEKKNVCGRGR